MYFVPSWLARRYACFTEKCFSLSFRGRKCHGAFSAQLKHKRKVSGLPYDTPPLSCGYICQRTCELSVLCSETEKGEIRFSQFSVIPLEMRAQPSSIWIAAVREYPRPHRNRRCLARHKAFAWINLRYTR